MAKITASMRWKSRAIALAWEVLRLRAWLAYNARVHGYEDASEWSGSLSPDSKPVAMLKQARQFAEEF